MYALDHRNGAGETVKAWQAYTTDAWQRWLLTLDTLRTRGQIFLDHLQAGKPALLKFEHELLMDGRDLPQPCNYSLMRIVPPADLPADPKLRPIIVIDPRAGHGPGIGGFKPDSEIGVAQRARHPVYFITFAPEPMEGQTLLDVARAEATFIEEVVRRHPKSPGRPTVIGNCQAGWAVAALAAVRSDLLGPIVLNGAPLSYWAGSPEQNPMRYSGGVLGGAWLSALSSDLSGDRFDGAHLVSNFENLNLANTYWDKYYHLYANVDTERERFLEFERWWGGYFRMTGEEIETIVENLFIGNRLARGEVELEGHRLDLRNIQAPMVIFASWGDNITPPQQALDWIIDVWGSEKALIKAGRTIVYMLHPKIGHLGIFVGASIARREHEQIVDTLEQVVALPPGLYEMKIDTRDPEAPLADLESGEYSVSFEVRTVDDIRALNPEGRRDEALFSTIAQCSEFNMQAYRHWAQPLVRATGSREFGEVLRWLHPLRQQRLLFSDLNPLAPWIRDAAAQAREKRQVAEPENMFRALEQVGSRWISDCLDHIGQQRDQAVVHWVESVYGAHGVGAMLPPRAVDQAAAEAHAKADEAEGRRVALTQVDQGGFPEAVCRILLTGLTHRGSVQRRGLILGQQLAASARQMDADRGIAASEDWASLLHRQALVVAFAPEEAIAALPRLLPTVEEREQALALATAVLMAESEVASPHSPASHYLHQVLGVDPARVVALAESLHTTPAATVSVAPPVKAAPGAPATAPARKTSAPVAKGAVSPSAGRAKAAGAGASKTTGATKTTTATTTAKAATTNGTKATHAANGAKRPAASARTKPVSSTEAAGVSAPRRRASASAKPVKSVKATASTTRRKKVVA